MDLPQAFIHLCHRLLATRCARSAGEPGAWSQACNTRTLPAIPAGPLKLLPALFPGLSCCGRNFSVDVLCVAGEIQQGDPIAKGADSTVEVWYLRWLCLPCNLFLVGVACALCAGWWDSSFALPDPLAYSLVMTGSPCRISPIQCFLPCVSWALWLRWLQVLRPGSCAGGALSPVLHTRQCALPPCYFACQLSSRLQCSFLGCWGMHCRHSSAS